MKLSINQRKVIIFVIAISVLIAATFFVELEFYQILSDKLVWLALGFFAGNGLEHIAGVFKK